MSVQRIANGYAVAYQPYTLRYPLESYDDGIDIPIVRYQTKDFREPPETHGGSGPIIVYPRKKRYSSKEISAIWEASEGKCHLCGYHWGLDQRGVKGWHIDHIIPHVGGGQDTEDLGNLSVACAKCNLRKGRGYTEKRIRIALRSLINWIEDKEEEMRKFRGGRK